MRADLRAKIRSVKSLARKVGREAPQQMLLIVCEDSKSSPAYFTDVRARLRLRAADVEVCGKECGSAPISVVSFALERRKTRKREGWPPDQVFCVIDVDHHETFDEARDRAEANKLVFVVSRPCFERWYLLHFVRGDAPYDTFDHLSRALDAHLPRYDKGAFADFDMLWARLGTALANAQRLRASRLLDAAQNAHTDVDIVVHALLNAAGMPPPQEPQIEDEARESAPKPAKKKGRR